MKNFTLHPGEEIIKAAGGDCWQTPCMMRNQVPGQYLFTNHRIVFEGNGIFEKLRVRFEIPYLQIQSVTPYWVVFFNTGILIRLKDGDCYRLSLRKRDQFMDIIHTFADL